jgi:hypothetical protein
MSQADLNIIPTIHNGVDLSDFLNEFRAALNTMHSGTNRPPYATAGIMWLDTASPTEWNIYQFDGDKDILLWTVNPVDGTINFANYGNAPLVIVGSFGRVKTPADLPVDGYIPAGFDGPGYPTTGFQARSDQAFIYSPANIDDPLYGHLYTYVGTTYAVPWLDAGRMVGPQGPIGPQGQQGVPGNTGETGVQGPQGEQGIQGAATIIKATFGLTKTPSDLPVDGFIPANWDGGGIPVKDYQMLIGESGIYTPANFEDPLYGQLYTFVGPARPEGWSRIGQVTGAQGPAGAQGVQGNPGPTGPQGVEGPQGPQGIQGPGGQTGGTGSQGPQGNPGSDGAAGPQGPQGPAGANSTVPGPQGPTGPQGPQGPQGVAGGTVPITEIGGMICAYYKTSIWVEGGTPQTFAPGTVTDGSTIYFNNFQSEFFDSVANAFSGANLYGSMNLTLISPVQFSTERQDFPGKNGSSPAGAWRMISVPAMFSSRVNSATSDAGDRALWTPGMFVRYA